MRPRHIASFACLAFAHSLGAQVGRVTGVIYDSVNKRPLPEAALEVVDLRVTSAAPRRAKTDSAGRFEVVGLPPGQYLVGFYHPLLDSLSLQSPTTRVTITGAEAVSAPLGVPSLTTIARVRCPRTADIDTMSTLIGRVVDASTLTGVDGASVRVWWRELYMGRGGVTHIEPGETLTTLAGGGFAFCGIPSATEIGIIGSHGADSTDLVVALTKEHGVLRRDLFIGHADSGSTEMSAVVRGVVRDNGGRPLPNAQVRVVNGTQVVRTTDEGRYELRTPPIGTREIEFRLVGYMPQTNTVDLHRGATSTVSATLLTVRQMMDTVKVTSTRVFDRDRNGFADRKKRLAGTFFDPSDVERLRPTGVAQLISRARGVTLEVPRYKTASYIMMQSRGGTPGGRCLPSIYIDNQKFEVLDANDLDRWITPETIGGIEVYESPTVAPVQYQTLNRCGVIVIWTRVPPPKKKPS
jgi:hypothetical protein